MPVKGESESVQKIVRIFCLHIFCFAFRSKLPPGTEVTFYDRTFKGEEYKDLSEDKVSVFFNLSTSTKTLTSHWIFSVFTRPSVSPLS